MAKKKRMAWGDGLDRKAMEICGTLAEAVHEDFIVAVIVIDPVNGPVFASNVERRDSARMLHQVADSISPPSSVRTTNPRHN